MDVTDQHTSITRSLLARPLAPRIEQEAHKKHTQRLCKNTDIYGCLCESFIIPTHTNSALKDTRYTLCFLTSGSLLDYEQQQIEDRGKSLFFPYSASRDPGLSFELPVLIRWVLDCGHMGQIQAPAFSHSVYA